MLNYIISLVHYQITSECLESERVMERIMAICTIVKNYSVRLRRSGNSTHKYYSNK